MAPIEVRNLGGDRLSVRSVTLYMRDQKGNEVVKDQRVIA
jgi:hypothetical protein